MRAPMVLMLALAGAHPLAAQGPRKVVASIETIHADSIGHAYRGRHQLTSRELDSIVTGLRPQPGAVIWFSWDGGPARPRTGGEEALLARIRRSGIRVELRSDSTMFSRLVPDR